MSYRTTGQLNDRITFVKKSSVPNANGIPSSKPVPVYSCWASLDTQNLKDMQSTVGTVLEDTVTFVIRYLQAYEITNKLQISYKNKLYNIINIVPGEYDKEFTNIIAKAVT